MNLRPFLFTLEFQLPHPKAKRKRTDTRRYCVPLQSLMVAELGFEPRQTESESVVLPLHNSASLVTSSIYYIQPHGKSQAFSREMPIFFRAYRSRARSATESRTNAIPASLDGVTASRKIPTPSTAATTGSKVAMMAACPACTPASPAV